MKKPTKVLLFPGRVGASVEMRQASATNFLGVLTTAHTRWTQLDVPLDAETTVRALSQLRSPGTVFVASVDAGENPQSVINEVTQRGMTHRLRSQPMEDEILFYLPPRRYTLYNLITHFSKPEDLHWAVERYGSLDRLRLYVTQKSDVDQVVEHLLSPEGNHFGLLLELCEYLGLFDYDWEYLYLLSRKIHVNHMLHIFHNVCTAGEMQVENIVAPVETIRIRTRIERLLRVPLF